MRFRLSQRLALGLLLLGWGENVGCRPKTAQVPSASSLESYVREAKQAGQVQPAGEGSLWVNHGRRSDLFRDSKAREVNDVLTIRVLESTQATASAEAAESKDAEMKAGFPQFFGLENKIKELPYFLSGQGSSNFEAKGSTSRETVLRTFITARVVDVLPNGYLLVEGTRDIRVNQENQSLYLSGIVRPEDVSRENIVISSAVGQMTVRLQGKGSVSRPINPGWLFKILNGILPF